MTEGESELTQLKNNYSRKERQITLSRQSNKMESVRLVQVKDSPFFSVVG